MSQSQLRQIEIDIELLLERQENNTCLTERLISRNVESLIRIRKIEDSIDEILSMLKKGNFVIDLGEDKS